MAQLKRKILKEIIELRKEPEVSMKATNTAFILMFPTLIIAGIAAFSSSLAGSILSIALVFYQFLMLKKFIEDYYKIR